MDKKRKANKFNILFVALIVIAGLLLMYTGNDALVLATEKKEGILTAEQVQVSFDSVGGRLVNEAVKEAQEVRKGEVLMVLDSTDIDLSIQQLEAQLAQLEAQIQSAAGTAAISMSQADTDEQQSFRQIDQQRAAVSAAEASYANSSLDYQRKLQLVSEGAVAQAELDNARMALDVAAANVTQQKQLLMPDFPGGTMNSTASYRTEFAGTTLEDTVAYIETLKASGYEYQDFYDFGMSEEDMLGMNGWWAYDGSTYLSVSYSDGTVIVDHTKELPDLESYFN